MPDFKMVYRYRNAARGGDATDVAAGYGVATLDVTCAAADQQELADKIDEAIRQQSCIRAVDSYGSMHIIPVANIVDISITPVRRSPRHG